MPGPLSRRKFFAATAAAGLTAADALACGRRPRCYPVVPCPPRPPCPPGPSGFGVRPNIHSLGGPQLGSLARAVRVMRELPDSDPRSWRFQANIHWTTDPASNPLFNQCEHGTLHFLAWHRGYLYFFERILRWASGDPFLMLPYWDWAVAPVLPQPFRAPGDVSNPLYDDTRLVNDGTPLAPEDTAGLGSALAAVPFAGGAGFSRRLEGNPHGSVHVAIGGNMGAVPTAARDPIFWLHHANIDRVWDAWLNLGGGRTNPADTAFLEKTYPFADETGRTVTVAVRDIISSSRLGYRYDSVPNPAGAVVAAGPTAAGEPPPQVVARSAAAPPEKAEGKPIGFEVERVRLKLRPEAKGPLAPPVAGHVRGPGRVLIRVEGISAAEPPAGVRYAVYLNPPAAALAGPERMQYFLGTLNFFGQTRADARGLAGHGHGKAAETFDETFDATEVIARLRQAGRWDPDGLDVVIQPVASVRPGQAEADARARAATAAKQADVRYKGVSVLVE